MDVVVYRTSSRHNVLTRMGASLVQAFQAAGVRAATYAPGEQETIADTMRTLAAAKTKVAIGFASVGADWRGPNGQSAHDALGCAFIGWDVDHPSFNVGRFALPMARRGQVFASASHADFAQGMGCRATSMLMLPGVDAVQDAPLPIAERPIHGLAAMHWIGEPEVWWADLKGAPVHTLIEGIVARALADPSVDLLAAFRATTGDVGAHLALDESMCALISRVGLFVRQYDRLRLAQTLAAADVPCVIVGAGWRERIGEAAHLHYVDELDVAELPQAYGQARVVFNLNGANGASERVVQAMAAGAMAASDHSPLLEASFGPQDAIRFYDRRDMGGVRDWLGMSSDDQQAVADRGRRAAAASHLWAHKAEALIRMLRENPFSVDLIADRSAAQEPT